jgi:ribosomal protein S18 acetylase RimI-like enzyme
MEIKILDQKVEDVLEVTRLIRETWLDTYPNKEFGITKEEILDKYDESKPDFAQRLERRRNYLNNNDDDHHSWVAKIGQKIVGFCDAKRGEENRIQAIYVLPDYQRKKVGGKLMQNTLDWIG